MKTYSFRLPDIGEGVAEAEITAWHIKVGDHVEEDQISGFENFEEFATEDP